MRIRPRSVILLLLLLLQALALWGLTRNTPRFDAPNIERVLYYAFSAIPMLLGVPLLIGHSALKRPVLSLLLPALLIRLILIPAAPSNDIYRYLWEGKLIRNGVSPYGQVADDPSVEAYRDPFWEQMNHRDKWTAYPPIPLLIFAASGAISYSTLSLKLLFILCDLGSLWMLILLLRQRGLSIAYSAFYAFNPIILVSFAAEAHFDTLLIFPLLLALWLEGEQRSKTAAIAAALSASVKWISLPLLPFFLGKHWFRNGIILFLTLFLPALLFLPTLQDLWWGLRDFGLGGGFNGPINSLLKTLGAHGKALSRSLAAVYLLLCMFVWFRRKRMSTESCIRCLIAGLLLLSPIVHLWYLSWLVPFLCLRPRLSWISLSLSSSLYLFVWIHAAEGDWKLTPLEQAAFWGPFLLFFAYDLIRSRGRSLLPRHPGPSNPESISVVIPTLHAAKALPQCLLSLEAQEHAGLEVIIADGGSEDETRSLCEASSLAPTWVDAPKGRGQQLLSGLQAARGDWVLFLHADARLPKDALLRLQRALRFHPEILGGALGQRFPSDRPGLTLIEWMNDLRALYHQTAFGDQVIFVQRQAALSLELMPDQPLMEDVEASMRITENGEFLYLGEPAEVAAEKWQPERYNQRFSLVIRLMLRYLGTRLKGRNAAATLSRDLYQLYYS